MVDKRKNKGFTFIEVLAVIVLLGVISTIAIMAVSKYIIKGRKAVYSNYEKNLEVAAGSYLTSNVNEMPRENNSVLLSSDTLIGQHLIDDMPDPVEKGKMCSGYVTVKNKKGTYSGTDNDYEVDENGSIIWKDSNTTNVDLKYKVCLICAHYKTSGCDEESSSDGLIDVVFDKNGGKEWSNSSCLTPAELNGSACTKKVAFGEQYGTLPEPVNVGYTFDGWYSLKEGGGKVTASSEVKTTSAHTLYAHWKVKSYLVKFRKNNAEATGKMADQTIIYNQATALSDNKFALNGYLFTSWNTKADGSGTSYTNKQVVTNLTSSASITLYAQWVVNSANTYIIRFNKNNEKATGTMPNLIVPNNRNVALTENSFKLRGHEFSGWALNPAGNVQYKDKGTINNLAKPNGEVTLYAKWTPSVYTVTYYGNGGKTPVSQVSWSDEATFGKNYKTKNSMFERLGYTFKGWNTKADGTGDDWTDRIDKDWKWDEAEDINLYAQWVPNKYTVTYHGNGGKTSSSQISWSNEATFDANYVTSKNTFNRVGYAFKGWNTKADGTGDDWTDRIDKDWKWVIAKDVDLYAQWQAINYTVTYYGTNGLYNGKTSYSETATYDSNYTISTNKFLQTGYTFKGWNTKVDGTGEDWTSMIGKNAKWIRSSNLILYAQWEKSKYKITYNGNGSTGGTTSSTTCTYGETCYLRSNGFSKTGHTFDGWYTAASGGTKYGSSTTLTSNIRVYAHWKVNSYTLSFDKNGGSGSCSSITKDYNTAWGSLCSVSRSGYDFVNWRDKSSTSTKITSSSLATSNKTAIANWAYCDPVGDWSNSSSKIKIYSSYSTTSYYHKRTGATTDGDFSKFTSVTTNNSWTSAALKHYMFYYSASGDEYYHKCFSKFDNLKPYTPMIDITGYEGSLSLSCNNSSTTYLSDRFCSININATRESVHFAVESNNISDDQSSTYTSGSSGFYKFDIKPMSYVAGANGNRTWRTLQVKAYDYAGNVSNTMYIRICFSNCCYSYYNDSTTCS